LSAKIALWAAFLFAAFLASLPAHAQSAFEPHTVAYVLCVTNETKKLALVTPHMEKKAIVENAFGACGNAENDTRTALAAQGVSKAALDERFVQIKKIIRQTAEDDIDRYRISARPR
jgi:hypothetical protein